MNGNDGLHRLALPYYRKHNVHVYAEVRVKVCGVTASSHKEAIDIAERILDHGNTLHRLYPDNSTSNTPEMYGEYVSIENGGFAEGVTGYTVDEANDPTYELTTQHDEHG